MKFLRVAVLTLACSGYSFAVNKDLLALQRDLDGRLDALQQALTNQANQIATLTGMITAMQNDTRRTADQVAGMQDVLRNAVTQSLGPVAGLSNQVQTTGEDVRALRDALSDLSARLERMDAKITDLKNQLQIMQNPPPAPGTGAPGGMTGPGGITGPNGAGAAPAGNVPATPPMGMTAQGTYTDAFRDMQAGNFDLAAQEFRQYLTYFPDTELAASAQYYLGQIAYNRGDYRAAIQAFDTVAERYPKNPRTADARLMKARALAKSGQRTKAIQEFRALIQAYPDTEDARKAQAALHDPTLFPATTTARRR